MMEPLVTSPEFSSEDDSGMVISADDVQVIVVAVGNVLMMPILFVSCWETGCDCALVKSVSFAPFIPCPSLHSSKHPASHEEITPRLSAP